MTSPVLVQKSPNLAVLDLESFFHCQKEPPPAPTHQQTRKVFAFPAPECLDSSYILSDAVQVVLKNVGKLLVWKAKWWDVETRGQIEKLSLPLGVAAVVQKCKTGVSRRALWNAWREFYTTYRLAQDKVLRHPNDLDFRRYSLKCVQEALKNLTDTLNHRGRNSPEGRSPPVFSLLDFERYVYPLLCQTCFLKRKARSDRRKAPLHPPKTNCRRSNDPSS